VRSVLARPNGESAQLNLFRINPGRGHARRAVASHVPSLARENGQALSNRSVQRGSAPLGAAVECCNRIYTDAFRMVPLANLMIDAPPIAGHFRLVIGHSFRVFRHSGCGLRLFGEPPVAPGHARWHGLWKRSQSTAAQSTPTPRCCSCPHRPSGPIVLLVHQSTSLGCHPIMCVPRLSKLIVPTQSRPRLELRRRRGIFGALMVSKPPPSQPPAFSPSRQLRETSRPPRVSEPAKPAHDFAGGPTELDDHLCARLVGNFPRHSARRRLAQSALSALCITRASRQKELSGRYRCPRTAPLVIA